MSDDATDHYADLLDNGPLPDEALCLTAVRGLSVDEALRRYGGFRSARTETLRDAGRYSLDAYPDELSLVVADEVDGWVLLAHDNGWEGASTEVLARLSTGTTAAVAYWNVDFDSSLAVAVDGRVHAFEFIVGESTDDPVLGPYLDGLDFEDAERMCAASLAFVERVSGVRLTDEWIRAPHPVSAVADDLCFTGPTGWTSTAAPELVGRPVDAAVDWACQAAGIRVDDDHPPVVDLYLRALEAQWARCLPADPDAPKVRRLQDQVRRRNADKSIERALFARAHAVSAIEGLRAGNVDRVLYNACQVDPARWPELRALLGR
ncbi:hypothetical protein GCM10022243_06600 [Saccharothrix violaceirubra]|uniref:Uncharacterized protein n=1 Tax=Saccharothrix violaceirubra TaxID=413306 RepID=A0A7W7SZ86_9PSEU|nr:DUF6461 domain-containing protein [Saccharothrix violaceirubra]MBB4963072.1 hypothetical protein [Saccharothrix violaceirubra]